MSSTFRHIPHLSLLSSKFVSRLTPSWFSSSSKGGGWASSKLGLSDGKHSGLPSYGKQHRGGPDYKDLDRGGGSENSFRMALVKPIRTFVHTGGPGEVEVEEDGIHLQYKVEQRSMADEGEGV